MRCHPETRAYVERRTKQGLSKLDIMRCLKRYIAREIYHHLTDPPAITPPATFSATIAEQHREELLSQADQARLAHDRRPKNRRWQWRAPRWERSATRPAKA
jgi:hypothetical protein